MFHFIEYLLIVWLLIIRSYCYSLNNSLCSRINFASYFPVFWGLNFDIYENEFGRVQLKVTCSFKYLRRIISFPETISQLNTKVWRFWKSRKVYSFKRNYLEDGSHISSQMNILTEYEVNFQLWGVGICEGNLRIFDELKNQFI